MCHNRMDYGSLNRVCSLRILTVSLLFLHCLLNTVMSDITHENKTRSDDDVLSALTITFDPPDEVYVTEQREINITFNIQWTGNGSLDKDPSSQWTTWNSYDGQVTIVPDPQFRLEVVSNFFNVTLEDFVDGYNRTLTFRGLVLGHVKLKIYLEISGDRSTTTTVQTSDTSTVIPSEPATLSVSPETTVVNSEDHGQVNNTLNNENFKNPVPRDYEKEAALSSSPDQNVFHEVSDGDLKEDAMLAEDVYTDKDILITAKPVRKRTKKHSTQSSLSKTTSQAERMEEPLNDGWNVHEAIMEFFSGRQRRSVSGGPFLEDSNTDIMAQSSDFVINGKYLLSNEYEVHVLRYHGYLDLIFLFIVGVFVLINTTMMGCQVELPVVWSVLKKPVGPAVGFVSQFAFMPLASYGLGYAFIQESNLQLGLFTLGCSPGGNGSNFWTLLLHGDINLSVTMTFISTLSAMFMMPMWMYTLGTTILSKGNIAVPFTSLITSLASFCVPVGIGVAIRHYRPHWTTNIKRIIRPFTIVLIIVLNVIGSINSLFIFRLMTWRILMAGLCVGWGGYAFGAVFAWACRMGRPQIIAVSIETAIQNAGITFMVLRLTLEQPDADLSSVAPVAQLMVTGLPLLFLYLVVVVYRRVRRCCGKRVPDVFEDDARPDGIDAVEPLVINRTSAVPYCPAKDGAPVSRQAGDDDNLDKQAPLYANMYQEYDDSYYESVYAKPRLQLKISSDGGLLRHGGAKFQMRTFDEDDTLIKAPISADETIM